MPRLALTLAALLAAAPALAQEAAQPPQPQQPAPPILLPVAPNAAKGTAPTQTIKPARKGDCAKRHALTT